MTTNIQDLVKDQAKRIAMCKKDLGLLGTGHFIDQRRLACQLTCYGDVTINLEEQIQKEKDSALRRPQGNLKKDSAEDSKAVTGNLIDQDQDILKESASEATEDSPEESPTSSGSFYDSSSSKPGSSKKTSKKSKSRNNRNRNSRNRSGEKRQSPESSEKSSASSQNKKKRNNNRRRNNRPKAKKED